MSKLRLKSGDLIVVNYYFCNTLYPLALPKGKPHRHDLIINTPPK